MNKARQGPNLIKTPSQVIERQKQISIQEQEITRKQKELDAQVIKPAEAERYQIEQLAEAEKWVHLIH